MYEYLRSSYLILYKFQFDMNLMTNILIYSIFQFVILFLPAVAEAKNMSGNRSTVCPKDCARKIVSSLKK